jgi:lipopolysaccharide transport system ATP-binding protein
MTESVIRVEALGKRYRLGEGLRHTALRNLLGDALRAPLRLLSGSNRASNEPPRSSLPAGGASADPGIAANGSSRFIWALKDVNFEVHQGEVVGLIGRNGAGKSTLLKILARITRPTVGHAEIHGRVGSLLEVGTGFHVELTGRENVYMSGAILGMRKAEIDRKFDEIVAFSEVERFLDTPLKHYSSGMQMRLAFAVAAHLEPEILLVDEVLAVGDITFQKKCLGKMGDFARSGRTVILVSHNMAAINALSSRVVFMRNGVIELDGSTSEVTARYYSESLNMPGNSADLLNRTRQGNGKARFSSVAVQALNAGQPLELAYPGCDLNIEVELECSMNFADCVLAVIIYDSNGYRVIDTNTAQKGEYVSLNAGQKGRASFLLREVLLKPGRYFLGLWLGRHGMEVVDDIEHAVTFDVVESKETSQHVLIYPGVYLCRFEHVFIARGQECTPTADYYFKSMRSSTSGQA